MKRKIQQLEGDSFLVGELPKGCSLCAKGSKMVLFVTGLCDSSCYYCPLSQEKAGADVVFADEMPVKSDEDILFEVNAIGGEGAGISGGDPLCTLDRTIRYITFLKKIRGQKFHIHLYTSQSDADENTLRKLKDAGLDEIRFHPQLSDWSGIETAIQLGMTVGIEVPALPNKSEELKKTAMRAEKIGVSFMNMNELESSETNFEKLVSMGMRLTSLDAASIEGSESAAQEVLAWASENLESLSVHFCSARFKDAVQMRKRLERRRDNIIREFEEKDVLEPLMILGIIRAPHGQVLNIEHLESLAKILKENFDVPSNLMNLDKTRMRIEIAAWILEEIHADIRQEFGLDQELEIGTIFEYPTWDRLQILFDPL